MSNFPEDVGEDAGGLDAVMERRRKIHHQLSVNTIQGHLYPMMNTHVPVEYLNHYQGYCKQRFYV